MSQESNSFRSAIVLIDHGSRLPEANEVVEAVAGEVRRRRPDCFVATAHLEQSPPTLPEAVDACVAAGVREIVVLPYFLVPGRHSTEDIPRLAREARERHPNIELRVSEPLGVHPQLVDVLLDRVDAS